LSDRIRWATARARAYLLFRRDTTLQRKVRDELASLRADVLAFDQLLGAVHAEARV